MQPCFTLRLPSEDVFFATSEQGHHDPWQLDHDYRYAGVPAAVLRLATLDLPPSKRAVQLTGAQEELN
jgi:hypothetical protein